MASNWIKVGEIEDGMVLARAIEDDMGRVLLRAGHELSLAYAARLEKMGVNEVLIEVKDDLAASDRPEAVGGAGSDTEKRRMTKNKLARRFAPHKENAIMRAIHGAAFRKLTRGFGLGD